MVLHVSASNVGIIVPFGHRNGLATELAEDLDQRLAHDIGQHVEAATVRHAHDHRLNAQVGSCVDEMCHSRDESLATLQAKAFGRLELFREERLKHGAPAEAVQQEQLLLLCRLRRRRQLDALLQPCAAQGVLNVHVLVSDGRAVGCAKHGMQLAQRPNRARFCQEALLAPNANVELSVHVGFGKAVVGWVQCWRRLPGVHPQRIEGSSKVPNSLVRPYKLYQFHGLLDALRHVRLQDEARRPFVCKSRTLTLHLHHRVCQVELSSKATAAAGSCRGWLVSAIWRPRRQPRRRGPTVNCPTCSHACRNAAQFWRTELNALNCVTGCHCHRPRHNIDALPGGRGGSRRGAGAMRCHAARCRRHACQCGMHAGARQHARN
mmetsp:Transcript_28107/g.83254  ORF Transcript_28107/g.83254 Transcript_28107/m.83254 type:complete len:378 (-) Transcript_28107:268-1401(-)